MRELDGYSVIGLKKKSSDLFNYRLVYVKKHEAKVSEDGEESELASDRTLYVVNLPSCWQDEDVSLMFENQVGPVQLIKKSIEEEKTKAGSLHVVFKSNKAVEASLALSTLVIPSPTTEKPTGLENYKMEYYRDRPGVDALKEITDEFMMDFDQKEEEAANERAAQKDEVDDDGFKKVVYLNKKRPINSVLALAPRRKKQKKKELNNFYRFQNREVKRSQLKNLREKFEEDRRRIEELKKARKFKPEI